MNKKTYSALFSLISLLTLSGCNKIADANPVKNENPASDKIIYREVDKSYLVKADTPQGISVAYVNPTMDSKHVAGSLVSFELVIVDETLRVTSVKVDGKALKKSGENYAFVMPNHDVTIEVAARSISDVDMSVEDVSSLPTVLSDEEGKDFAKEKAFFADLKSRLEASDAVENDYFREATLSVHGESKAFSDLNLPSSTGSYSTSSIKAVNSADSKGIKVSTNYTDNNKNHYNYRSERGLQGNFYYTQTGRDGYYESNTKKYISETHTLTPYTIVDDSVEKVPYRSIKKSEAEYKSAAVGFGGMILNGYFSEGSSALDYVVSATDDVPEHYANSVSDMKVTKSADNKSFDCSFTLFSLSSAYAVYKDVLFTFDGNGLIRKAKYTNRTYAARDYDKTGEKLNDDAKMTSETYFDLSLTAGYKYEDGLTDLKAFAMEDYDLGITMILDGKDLDFSEKYSFSHKVYDGAELSSFFFQNNHLENGKPGVLKPTYIGTDAGEEDYIRKDGDKLYVDKVGTFHLNFDNGFGLKKKFEITSVTPNVSMMTSTLTDAEGNSVEEGRVGTDLTLNVKVLPSKSNQAVTVTATGNDAAGTTFVKNADGSYKVSFAKEGIAEFEIVSDENPEVKKTVKITVYGTLDLNALKANLADKTFVAELSYSNYNYQAYLNFNPDATGLSGIAQIRLVFDYTKYSGDVVHNVSTLYTFKWTLDATSFNFTLALDDSEGASKRMTLIETYGDYYFDMKSFSMKSSGFGSMVMNRYYYESSTSGSDVHGDGSFQDKVDLSALK